MESNPKRIRIQQVFGPCQKFRPDLNGLFTNFNKLICLTPEYCLNKVDWKELSRNANATHILDRNISRVDWCELLKNPNALYFFQKHSEKVDWRELSKCPDAVPLLEKNLDKVDWFWLSGNPNAIHILEKHMRKVDLTQLIYNPSPYAVLLQFPEQTRKIKQQMKLVFEQLKKEVLLPNRISRMALQYQHSFLGYLSILTGIQSNVLLEFFHK